MRRFIFLERNGIYILDIQKTQSPLEKAQKVVREVLARGGTVLFVGTKRPAQDTSTSRPRAWGSSTSWSAGSARCSPLPDHPQVAGSVS
jgi:small subunit ribosomal protein S2